MFANKIKGWHGSWSRVNCKIFVLVAGADHGIDMVCGRISDRSWYQDDGVCSQNINIMTRDVLEIQHVTQPRHYLLHRAFDKPGSSHLQLVVFSSVQAKI